MATDAERGTYGAVSILNHWVLAIAAIVMIFVGVTLEDMPRGDEKMALMALHKASGVIVLVLASWRLYWRVRNGFPPLAGDTPPWEALAAKAAHWFLLIALIVMPASGMIWSLFGDRAISIYGLFTIPALGDIELIAGIFRTIHHMLPKALMAVIVLHLLAALKRQFINGDGTLSRMLGIGPRR